jgi:ParB-like chromosome segregation protein Spo0J
MRKKKNIEGENRMLPENAEIPLSKIYVPPNQGNIGDCTSLAEHIKTHGQINLITVRKLRDDESSLGDFDYKVLSGFRRIAAHKINKMDTIHALVYPANV